MNTSVLRRETAPPSLSPKTQQTKNKAMPGAPDRSSFTKSPSHAALFVKPHRSPGRAGFTKSGVRRGSMTVRGNDANGVGGRAAAGRRRRWWSDRVFSGGDVVGCRGGIAHGPARRGCACRAQKRLNSPSFLGVTSTMYEMSHLPGPRFTQPTRAFQKRLVNSSSVLDTTI